MINVEPVTSTLALPSTVALYDNSVSSTSLADNSYTKILSSSMLWLGISDNTGASLIGLTPKIKLSESVNDPSLTVTLTAISP